MTAPTRDEFLSHVHPGLAHPETAPKKGSPTKSTQRYRWRELLSWDAEAQACAYWDSLDWTDKTAILPVAGYWAIAQLQVDSDFEEFASEPGLRSPFNSAFKHPHNLAIRGAGDKHAEMRSEGSSFAERPLANADYFMVYDGKVCGLIELKTWWKVTEAEIEEVRSGTAPLSGEHHGRLAIEQAYGYMCFDQVHYGIMATYNAFLFLKRENGGILHMSRTIPITATTPTILKLLYFFSHLCALHTEPYPETNSSGIPIHLKSAPKTPDKAPKVPDPNYQSPTRATALAPPNVEGPRRSMRFTKSTDELYLDVARLTSLGCKGWRGTLTNGRPVFAKLWDGWKFPASHSEHEALVYYRLRDLWTTIVPDFIGLGQWGFCHILLLSDVDCSMLHEIKYTPKIGRNVINAFKKIHARGVCHGDVRCENILIRSDGSVVIVDFEMSTIDSDQDELNAEIREIKYLLASLKGKR